jgi:sugar phosphate isomerase/epimerase
VNIAGSRTGTIRAPAPENLCEDALDVIAGSVREIIDGVRPTRAFYTLEMMPWLQPDSPESYVRLIELIDRPQFGVHVDPVNIITSPGQYYANGELIRSCFRLLGPHVKSCHAKDVRLANSLTVHIDEVKPGTGELDYVAFLTEAEQVDPDLPLMLEHLASDADYAEAAAYIRGVAAGAGIRVQ